MKGGYSQFYAQYPVSSILRLSNYVMESTLQWRKERGLITETRWATSTKNRISIEVSLSWCFDRTLWVFYFYILICPQLSIQLLGSVLRSVTLASPLAVSWTSFSGYQSSRKHKSSSHIDIEPSFIKEQKRMRRYQTLKKWAAFVEQCEDECPSSEHTFKMDNELPEIIDFSFDE